MRNLKRVLSLALALVMMLGMMIVGASAASADFPDAAEIDYTEAVDVISGLGIMTGDEKGNFNPDLILTREQAAKIICYVLMGAENAEKLGNNTQIFADVAAGRWSAGYIAYCANLGILVGDGNGLFRPEDNLTGVQFGKMLLVAAGYNADTQGYANNADWATNIATDMIDNGLDIKGVILANDLTREQAAQMVLQAMDMETVTYTTGNVVGLIGPFPAEETFAEKYFPKLEKISGVVTANEYADLYGDTPLKAGKTEIDGKTYKGTTALTDIGESRVGWANDGTILYLADSGKNVVFQTGAATKVDTKFKKANGIGSDAEWYVNFGGDADAYESDYRIEYVLEGLTFTAVVGDGKGEYKNADAADEAAAEYFADFGVAAPKAVVDGSVRTYTIAKDIGRAIPAGKDITAADLFCMKTIFTYADKEEDASFKLGEVYVGTKSVVGKDDISDEISYKEFYNKYINDDTAYAHFDETKNGEWLKVVDNDNDGEADYVFLTKFTMSVVTDISKKGEITIPEIETDKTKAGYNADEMAVYDELEEDDVVIYTIIDGVAHVKLADFFEATVKKYNYKNEILTTTDDEEYQQSGIEDLTDYIYDAIEDLDDTTYIFYQDFFGYIRVAALPDDGADNYVLLTEFYNTGSNKDNLISTKTLIAETVTVEEEVEEYEVATVKKAWDVHDGLIDAADTSVNDNHVRPVAGTDYDGKDKDAYTGSWTNVAAYTLKDDTISLDTAYNIVVSRQNKLKAETDYIALAPDAITKGQKHFDIADTDVYTGKTDDTTHTGDYINVTQNTVIFYVLGKSATKIETVDVVTGYSNIVPVKNINAVYAVADRTQIDTVNGKAYWSAKILVIEAEDYEETYKDALAFVYSNPEKETSKVFSLEDIAAAGNLDTLYVKYEYSNGQYNDKNVNALAFYPTHEDKSGNDVLGDEITSNFAKWNIYAAQFKRVREEVKMDYIDIVVNGKVESIKMPESAVAYTLSADKNDTYNAAKLDLSDRNEKGDRIIYVTNNKDEIIYVIDVDASFTGKTEAAALKTLVKLYEAIEKDAIPGKTDAQKAQALLDQETPWTEEQTEEAKKLATALAATDSKSDAELAEKLTKRLNSEAADTERQEALAAAEKYLKETYLPAVEADTDTVPDVKAADLADVLDKVLADMKKIEDPDDIAAYVSNVDPYGEGVTTLWNAAKALQKEINEAKAAVATIGDANYDTLAKAIENAKKGDVITLVKDITLSETANIPEGVTLDGNGKTVTYTGVKGEKSYNSAIVLATDATLKDITVQGTKPINVWDSCYGVQAYNATGVIIEDVTVKGCNAGILINGSSATLEGTIDVSGNGFGGIEVSKGDSLTTNSTLAVKGTVINTSESETNPTAWTECEAKGANAQGTITGTDWTQVFLNNGSEESPKYQIFWFMDSKLAQ